MNIKKNIKKEYRRRLVLNKKYTKLLKRTIEKKSLLNIDIKNMDSCFEKERLKKRLMNYEGYIRHLNKKLNRIPI